MFESEQRKALRKTRELEAQLPPPEDIKGIVRTTLMAHYIDPAEHRELFIALAVTLAGEPFFYPIANYDETSTTVDLARVQTQIELKLRLHRGAYMKAIADHLLHHLLVPEGDGPFETTVGDVLKPNIAQVVYNFAHVHRDIFPSLHETMKRNVRLNDDLEPEQSKLPRHAVFDAYLRNTEFLDYLKAKASIPFPIRSRMNHTQILAKPGAGKTTLIEMLIIDNLAARHPVIVIDSQRDLIQRLAHANIWVDDPLLIDPSDIEHPVSLNIFDAGPRAYSGARQEQAENAALDSFNYLLENVFHADLSAKQGTFFQFAVRLMFAVKGVRGQNATLLDLRHFMDEPSAYTDVIDRLPDFERDFFTRDVLGKNTYKETREQIRYRLNAILGNPALRRCFSRPTSTVDFFETLNSGRSVLIDTAGEHLGSFAKDFGKFAISMLLRAVLERAAIPEDERKPVFLYVDEAWQYFDTNISDLLVQARKYQCAVTLSHQLFSYATPQLRAALLGATSNKFAAPSHDDARTLAGEMRSTADFIANQPPLHLAAFISGVTPTAISVEVHPGALARHEKRDYAAFLERNRAGVAYKDVRAAPLSSPPDEEPFDFG